MTAYFLRMTLMAEIRFFNPSGKLDISQRHASRLPTLAGKKIGLLANGEWQSLRALGLLQRMLEKDFPGVEVLPPEHFPEGNAVLSEPDTIQSLKQAGLDGVIIGNAA